MLIYDALGKNVIFIFMEQYIPMNLANALAYIIHDMHDIQSKNIETLRGIYR